MKKPERFKKRMGYVKDQEGIMNRYMRETSHWKPHLEKTRNFISGSFKQCKAETVAILGSGWLLDVPLETLLERFKHIYLVDIHHPVQIRKKTAGMKQLELIEEDLTGGALEQVWQLHKNHRVLNQEENFSDQIFLKAPLRQINPDVLISANLLNQLDILLCDYIRERGLFQQADLTPFRTAIQTFHLNWIQKKPACLITDVSEEIVEKNGLISSKSLLYTILPGGFRNESWWWDFDNLGTYHPGSRTRMEVQAVEWS
jgi:hypothetical protein